MSSAVKGRILKRRYGKCGQLAKFSTFTGALMPDFEPDGISMDQVFLDFAPRVMPFINVKRATPLRAFGTLNGLIRHFGGPEAAGGRRGRPPTRSPASP
jgi:hypothetical protein